MQPMEWIFFLQLTESTTWVYYLGLGLLLQNTKITHSVPLNQTPVMRKNSKHFQEYTFRVGWKGGLRGLRPPPPLRQVNEMRNIHFGQNT